MDYIGHIKELKQKNAAKILLLVLDGLGGLPVGGQTALEAAHKPNLDSLSRMSALGLTDPIAPGFTPGSGPAHLSLFGYGPLEYSIGRGILEALGVGLDIGNRDIAVRGNFATLKNGIVVDRRAGRISTKENKDIINYLANKIQKIDDVEIILKSGEEHRFVLVMRGDGLNDNLEDADPQKENLPPVKCIAKDRQSFKTSEIVNKFISLAGELLKEQDKANFVLLRGFSKYPQLPQFQDIYGLDPACIATYPMYKGLAKLVGMKILQTGTSIRDQVDTLELALSETKHDFFFFHIKKTDSYGEDGNFISKVKIIEEFDSYLPMIMNMPFEVTAITADHSTPSKMGSHSWHPNPLLINSPYEYKDNMTFSEKECRKGSIGRTGAVSLMPMLMANANKLKKYGA